MKTRSLYLPCAVAVSALAFSVSAFAQDAAPTTPAAPDSTPAASAPGAIEAPAAGSTKTEASASKTEASSAKLTAKEKTFAIKAAGGNLAEAKLGELASTKGASDDVKSFGQQMVTDHGKANTDLEAVYGKIGMKFEPKLNAKQQATFDKLSALSGAAFDKAYVADMLNDHTKDVAEYKEMMKTTKNADLKSYESETLPVIEHHLMMIKDISKKSMSSSKKSS